MVARNDITGDAIQTRANNEAFEQKFDIIFGSEEKEKLAEQKRKEKAEYWAKLEAETKAKLEAFDNKLDK